jgi:hypothetical protein
MNSTAVDVRAEIKIGRFGSFKTEAKLQLSASNERFVCALRDTWTGFVMKELKFWSKRNSFVMQAL